MENQGNNNREVNKQISSIVICFGGSDFKNLTAQVLSWIPRGDYSVTVITGSAYSSMDSLSNVIEERKDLNIELKSSLSAVEMRSEFEKTDLAIVPASGILFEAISTKVPIISGFYIDNQLSIYNGFLSKNAFFDANNFSEMNFLHAFNKRTKKEVLSMVKNQAQLIDQESGTRIEKEFINLC